MDKEQQAIERLREHVEWAQENEWEVPFCMAYDLFAAADKLTADVAPVRHGRWVCIRKGYGEYECSVCRGVDSNCSDYYGTHVVTEQEYCPNCGAKMDEEETT